MSRRMWMQVITRLALIAVLTGALVNALFTLADQQAPVLPACGAVAHAEGEAAYERGRAVRALDRLAAVTP